MMRHKYLKRPQNAFFKEDFLPNRSINTIFFVPLHRIFILMRIIMARPIRETPVLKGEDAFNFEMRRLEVEHMSKEQRAENRRKFEARVAEAKKYINVCI